MRGVPRKLRIEYENALYHVLNRVELSKDVFETVEARAFVEVLEEGSAIFWWRVYAYVVMRNHYHLAIETPKANLVDGMHWVQGISARFKPLSNVRGHLFKGGTRRSC